jgi:hypothetical protein
MLFKNIVRNEFNLCCMGGDPRIDENSIFPAYVTRTSCLNALEQIELSVYSAWTHWVLGTEENSRMQPSLELTDVSRKKATLKYVILAFISLRQTLKLTSSGPKIGYCLFMVTKSKSPSRMRNRVKLRGRTHVD